MMMMMMVHLLVVDLFLVPHISLLLTEEDDPMEEADSWVPPSAPIKGDSTFKLATHITYCGGYFCTVGRRRHHKIER
jgi:hypothetical protein